MKHTNHLYFKACFVFLILFSFNKSYSQNSKEIDLHSLAISLDSAFFENAYNHCDIDNLTNMMTEDIQYCLEHHGFMDRKLFLDHVKNHLCHSNYKRNIVIRKIKPKSLKIYPLYNQGKLYGFIGRGTQDFYFQKDNKKNIHIGSSDYIETWLNIGGKWKMKVMFSFDYQDLIITKINTLE